ncbi:hypothetical protein EYF80_062069 [Liparis tanakae]|uniref:Uncharacterized protein n=1 Tax=Liparis tanakae TaxID=230148 RepID=A0A4Z2EG78_9TELE|nr:hypothetical protein EYF80_062069 [Liparis tanakae]
MSSKPTLMSSRRDVAALEAHGPRCNDEEGGGRRRREEGGGTFRSTELQLITAGLSLSLIPLFPCLSHPLHCQSAFSPFAGTLLFLPVASHQSLDLPWTLALSTNYTVRLDTLTATAEKISAPSSPDAQPGKQLFTEYLLLTHKFKLTSSNMQQLIRTLRAQQSIRCI